MDKKLILFSRVFLLLSNSILSSIDWCLKCQKVYKRTQKGSRSVSDSLKKEVWARQRGSGVSERGLRGRSVECRAQSAGKEAPALWSLLSFYFETVFREQEGGHHAIHHLHHGQEDHIDQGLVRLPQVVWCRVQRGHGVHPETRKKYWKGQCRRKKIRRRNVILATMNLSRSRIHCRYFSS